MKICHLTSVHRYQDTRIFIKECQSLARYFETHLVAVGAPNEIQSHVHIHGVPRTNKNRLMRMTSTVWKVYRKALEVNAELYHFHDPELIIVGLMLKMRGKRVIYDSHEDLPREIMSKPWIKKPVRKLISVFMECIENFSVKRFDAVVAATPFIKKRFAKLGCRTVDINNYPVLNELISPKKTEKNMKRNRAVCYVGGISTVRGINEMVNAIAETEDVTLILGGNFQPEQLRGEISRLHGWSRVEFLGFLSRGQVASLFSEVMAGLVLFHPEPNHINARPNKMFEYMAAGLPVIGADFELWKLIIEGNHCGLCVDPKDTKKISESIQWIVEHPEKAAEMGENGRKAVEMKYNWELESKKLLKLYRNLLSNGKVHTNFS